MDNKAQKVFKWYIKNKGVPINVSSTHFFASRLKAFGLLDDANRFIEEVVALQQIFHPLQNFPP